MPDLSSRLNATRWPPASSTATVIGTSFIAQQHIAYALALSAGVTIYVAASDLIPEVNREDNAPGLAYTVFAGLLFFVLVDWAFSEILGH